MIAAPDQGPSFEPDRRLAEYETLLDIGVTVSGDKQHATVRSEDGQRVVFTAGPGGTWTAPSGARSSRSATTTSRRA